MRLEESSVQKEKKTEKMRDIFETCPSLAEDNKGGGKNENRCEKGERRKGFTHLKEIQLLDLKRQKGRDDEGMHQNEVKKGSLPKRKLTLSEYRQTKKMRLEETSVQKETRTKRFREIFDKCPSAEGDNEGGRKNGKRYEKGERQKGITPLKEIQLLDMKRHEETGDKGMRQNKVKEGHLLQWKIEDKENQNDRGAQNPPFLEPKRKGEKKQKKLSRPSSSQKRKLEDGSIPSNKKVRREKDIPPKIKVRVVQGQPPKATPLDQPRSQRRRSERGLLREGILLKEGGMAKISSRLGKRLFSAAMKHNLIGLITKDEEIQFSDRPGLCPLSTRPLRRSNIQEMVKERGSDLRTWNGMNVAEMVKTLTPSSLYLNYLVSPTQWIEEDATPLATTEEMFDAFQLKKELDPSFVENKLQNTRLVEQDTTFPKVIGQDVRCVVIGDTNVISTTFDCSLPYSDSAAKTVKALFGIGKEDNMSETQRHFKRTNNFPVLVGLEHAKVVMRDGEVYKVDAYETSKKHGYPICALLLCSCTDIIHRIQTACLDVLYKVGEISICDVPIEGSTNLYRLRDDDKVSILLRLRRSDSILYQSFVYCAQCYQMYEELWTPNNELRVNDTLAKTSCRECGGKIKNASCFVMNDPTSHQSLDPASVRKIRWEKKGRLGEKGCELPTYQQVWPTVCPTSLKLYAMEDYTRKNQRVTSIAVPLFIPTTYSKEALLSSLRDAGMEAQIDNLHEAHQMNLSIYHEDGEEHEFSIVATRVKLSVACNKKIEFTVAEEQHLNTIRREFIRLGKCVRLGIQNNGLTNVTIDLPSMQTTKRIGVQTVDQEGKPISHRTMMLMTKSKRVEQKRQNPERVDAIGTMFSAQNFWQHVDYSGKDNFQVFGLSVVAGLVNNLYWASTIKMGTRELHLLEKKEWLDIDNIRGTVSQESREFLERKSCKKMRLLYQKLEASEKALGKKKEKLNTSPNLVSLEREVDRLRKKVSELEEENHQLRSLLSAKDTFDRLMEPNNREDVQKEVLLPQLGGEIERLRGGHPTESPLVEGAEIVIEPIHNSQFQEDFLGSTPMLMDDERETGEVERTRQVTKFEDKNIEKDFTLPLQERQTNRDGDSCFQEEFLSFLLDIDEDRVNKEFDRLRKTLEEPFS